MVFHIVHGTAHKKVKPFSDTLHKINDKHNMFNCQEFIKDFLKKFAIFFLFSTAE